MLSRTSAVVLVVLLVIALRGQQTPGQRAAWNQPVEPFRIIGNIYYVGAAGVSAFLIRTPDGGILLDGGLPETAARIVRSLETLGAGVRDVKYLLNSHAHYDHAGGLAELKRLSGATLAIAEGDAPMVRTGGKDMPAVAVDRILRDGDTISLGGTVLTAHVTPGHTKGCTTWTMTAREGGRDYRVLFHCSTSVVDTLIGNKSYPAILEDYRRTFARLRAMEADVFLGPHPSFFDMDGKRKKMQPGAPNPFIDSSELRRATIASEQQFESALAKQRAGAALN